MISKESGVRDLPTRFANYVGFIAITIGATAVSMCLLYALCVSMLPAIAAAFSKDDYLLLTAQVAVLYLVVRNVSRAAVYIRNATCRFVGISILADKP